VPNVPSGKYGPGREADASATYDNCRLHKTSVPVLLAQKISEVVDNCNKNETKTVRWSLIRSNLVYLKLNEKNSYCIQINTMVRKLAC